MRNPNSPAEKRRLRIKARNAQIDLAWGDKPEPMHAKSPFRATGLHAQIAGLHAAGHDRRVDEEVGCTIPSLDYRGARAPKAPPVVAGRATDAVSARRRAMGTAGNRVDRNFDDLVERSAW